MLPILRPIGVWPAWPTSGSARFSTPGGIAVDRSGVLYVNDILNYRVRRITPEGEVFTLAGSVTGYADGVGTNALFDQLASIAVDRAGYVYIGTVGQIRWISPSGVVTTVAGSSFNFSDRDGTGDVAEFYFVQGLAVDAAGSLHLTSGAQFAFRGEQGNLAGVRVRMVERVFSGDGP